MTEAEWLESTSPAQMFGFLPVVRGANERRFRLFACACVRRVWSLLDAKTRAAMEIVERHADGLASPSELEAARTAVSPPARTSRWDYTRAAVSAVWWAMWGTEAREWCHQIAKCTAEHASQAKAWSAVRDGQKGSGRGRKVRLAAEAENQLALLRDIFGNPFRPVTITPSWVTSTVAALARGIYDDRAFDRMPILADALQDAGCEDEDVLGHCRGPGPHVRGCWAVDLLLGKA